METIVAILPRQQDYARQILVGIRDHMRAGRQFAVRNIEPGRRACSGLTSLAGHEDIRGVVAFCADRGTEQAVASVNVPAVNVSARLEETTYPRVTVDNRAVGQLAARHFLDLGVRHFAYVGYDSLAFSRRRRDGFTEELHRRGLAASVIAQNEYPETMAALTGLPRPLALFCCHDEVARRLLDRCVERGWRVPEDVLVLGVDNSVYECEAGLVSLSSVPSEGQRVGYQAVELLTQLIDGQPPPDRPVLLPPGPVVQRESTDLIAAELPGIAEAIRYIRTHACEGIDVSDVVAVSGLSRATVDRHVADVLGRTPHEEIRRVQIGRARRLLRETNLRVADVASACGFRQANYFMRVFREETGQTPTAWRRSAPLGPSRQRTGD